MIAVFLDECKLIFVYSLCYRSCKCKTRVTAFLENISENSHLNMGNDCFKVAILERESYWIELWALALRFICLSSYFECYLTWDGRYLASDTQERAYLKIGTMRYLIFKHIWNENIRIILFLMSYLTMTRSRMWSQEAFLRYSLWFYHNRYYTRAGSLSSASMGK